MDPEDIEMAESTVDDLPGVGVYPPGRTLHVPLHVEVRYSGENRVVVRRSWGANGRTTRGDTKPVTSPFDWTMENTLTPRSSQDVVRAEGVWNGRP